jgi:heat induced stress protein YflT
MQTHSDLIAEKLEKSGTSVTVALYYTYKETEEAVRELQKSGVDMQKLSIVGKDLWGAMFGTSFFLIPGIGPLLAAGPIVSELGGTVVAPVAGKSLSLSSKWRGLEGTVVVGGWSALGSCLYNLGIPEDSNIEYESQIKAGNFILIAHGSLEEMIKIQDAIAVTRHRGLREYADLRSAGI